MREPRALLDPRPGRRRLLVTTSYPRHPDDPAGCFVADRVQALIAGGERVQVIAAGPDEGGAGPPDDVVRVPFAVGGAPALFYGSGAPEAFEAAPFGAACQAARFWGGLLPAIQARVQHADIVESHWLAPSSLALAVCAPALPHLAHAHSGDVALLERLPGGGALGRWLLARLSGLALVSGELAGRLRGLIGDPSPLPEAGWMIAPAQSALVRVPLPRPAPAERHARLRARGLAPPLLLAVGRLVPIKGHDLLVRAVGRLPPGRRPALVILGEGPARGALTELARRRAVTLRLPGEVAPGEVRDWLALADLFVQPSRARERRQEGQPLALREALAAGLPAIAAASGGVSELAGRPGLTLVPVEDPAALAAALERHLIETEASPVSPALGGSHHVSGA